MKGQYFLPMVLIALFLVTIIFVYYSGTNLATIYSNYAYKPTLGDELAKASLDLKKAYIESIYLGDWNHFDLAKSEIINLASSRGETMQISCTNGSNANKFWLACDLNLTSGPDQARTSFNFTYTVDFKIETYIDKNFAQETDYFYKGDTVHLWITGNNSDVLNISILDPYGNLFKNWTAKLENWHWNGSFKPSISGNWTIVANDTNTSVQIEKKIHVNVIKIELKTFNENGVEQTDFYPGDIVNVSVWLQDLYNQKPNCTVKVDFTNAIGKQSYSLQGKAENGFFTGLVLISPWEIPGTMSITATEHCYWSQDQTNITILETYWDRFIKIIPPRMKYNKNHSSVFGDSCGYADWYASNETSYGSPPNEIPFYVENESASDTLLVNQTTITIDVPNANISWIHFLGSKRVV